MLGTGTRPLTAVSVVLALSGATLVTACGGGDDGGPTASIESVPTTPVGANVPKDGVDRAASSGKRSGSKPDLPAGVRLKPGSARERAITKAVARLPESRRAKAVRQVARAVFGRYGFESVKIKVLARGNALRASLGSREGCLALPGTERNLINMLHDGVPWLRAVQVLVGSQSLSQYVRSSCSQVSLPGGSGRVLLTQQGTILKETKRFTVDSDRWTVEYINGGGLLQVFVMKDGTPTGGSFRVAKRGPGRKVLKGAGKYSLQVAGSGEWIVRVRDGA